MARMRRREDGDKVGQSNLDNTEQGTEVSRMHHLCGFDWSDFSSWQSFTSLMNSPRDPAALAVYRFCFGLLMVIDIPQERGLAHADYKWGDPDECRFPLFDFLSPLPIQWMYIVYLLMLAGATGIMLGLFYRLSCVLFTLTYWYVFLLDKMSWNNHSYLYGIHGLLFLITDANRQWSLDGLLRKKIRNAHVPLWNYYLFRMQIFLVYFIAGLKKLDSDWVGGYSMTSLSKHWVFMPFTMVMSNELVDLIIVHWGGLVIDLFIGYFLFFDATRKIAIVFGTMFHCMNSQIFSIGMFPYAMMAANTIFFWTTWPKNITRKLPSFLHCLLPSMDEPQTSQHCIYKKHQVKSEESHEKSKTQESRDAPPTKSRLYHNSLVIFTICYTALQCFLPYSHFLTKGYNNWTNGLYGYSWDMMVHSWSTQHIRVTYVDHDTGKVGYLNPEAWSRSRQRWSSHGDMLKQYSTCVAGKLEKFGVKNVSLYIDIWRSLNERFQQRMVDPRVDLLTAEWHPFTETTWVMPLLTDLSNWRAKLYEIETTIYKGSNDTDVVFIADFPGLVLENYIQEDFQNTTITVLRGEIIVQLLDQDGVNRTLREGDIMQLPAGEYHNVHTVTDEPSCYMYIFVNTTETELSNNLTKYQKLKDALSIGVDAGVEENAAAWEAEKAMKELDPSLRQSYEYVLSEKKDYEVRNNRTIWDKLTDFVTSKYLVIKRSAFMTRIAVHSIVTGQQFVEVFNASVGVDETLGWNTQ